jgi:hypothetical protein
MLRHPQDIPIATEVCYHEKLCSVTMKDDYVLENVWMPWMDSFLCIFWKFER